MSRIDRIRHSIAARRAARADSQWRDDAPAANLPVPAGPAVTKARPLHNEPRGSEAEVSAHLIGQEGQRRGLRGGQSVLDIARETYSRIEWSGSWDRRARKGRQARTDV